MSVLTQPHFHDEVAAFEMVESIVWPNGPVCPHCGGNERIYALKGVRSKASKKNPEGVERHGLKKCGHCRKQFTVRVGTIFEDSHIPLHLWLQAFHLLCSSKKGISSHQLHRVLEVKYQTAWFLSHRIREAMRTGALAPMGGAGSSGIVEADETFIGTKKGAKKRRGAGHKMAVLSLVERNGEVRSVHVEDVKADTLVPIVNANIAKEAKIMTDDAAAFLPSRPACSERRRVGWRSRKARLSGLPKGLSLTAASPAAGLRVSGDQAASTTPTCRCASPRAEVAVDLPTPNSEEAILPFFNRRVAASGLLAAQFVVAGHQCPIAANTTAPPRKLSTCCAAANFRVGPGSSVKCEVVALSFAVAAEGGAEVLYARSFHVGCLYRHGVSWPFVYCD